MRRPDEVAPLIVGGGPAGAAAAIALARAGVRATVLERQETRQKTPGDAICGGFLSWATLARIEALGIDRAVSGGHDIDTLAIFAGRSERIVALPAPAIGLSRRRLDRLLLDAAEAAGAVVRRGVLVQSGAADGVILSTGEALGCDGLFLATGKHDLRGLARPRPAGDPELGLRLRLPPSPALDRLVGGRIELHLFDRGYLGLVLQEDGSANACMAVRKSRLAQADGDPAMLFAQLADASPALADRLADMPRAPRIDAIGNVPYGWRARDTRPGLFRLGDQAAVIPSLAGEGMGIALASAARAAASWLAEGGAGASGYQRRFARDVARPIAVAGGVKALGQYPGPFAILASMPGAARLAARLTRVG